MSSDKSDTPEKPEVPSLPGNLDNLPEYVPPRPTNLDPFHGSTRPRDAAEPSILSRNPDDPLPSLPALPPPTSHIPTTSIVLFEDRPAEATPPSLPPPSHRSRPSRKEKEPVKAKPEPKPKPSKQPMSRIKRNNGPKSSPATSSSVSIPRWGVDFPRTGFTPSGPNLTSGSLKGHLSKAACRSTPPAGTSHAEWAKKFRSAESVLMKQLKQIHGSKAGKAKLDDMRDQGWVHDRAVYMLEKEKEKKAAKEAANTAAEEEKDEDGDVEMTGFAANTAAEEEMDEDKDEDEKMEDVWGGAEDDD